MAASRRSEFNTHDAPAQGSRRRRGQKVHDSGARLSCGLPRRFFFANREPGVSHLSLSYTKKNKDEDANDKKDEEYVKDELELDGNINANNFQTLAVKINVFAGTTQIGVNGKRWSD